MSSDGSEECLPHSLRVPDKVTHRPHALVIAHRGASAHIPEHTLPAYRLALELGADFIEPDLCATSDGVLVAMHSIDLNLTTNVADVFADRDPWFSPTLNRTGYWVFNFTYDEVAQLRVQQRLPAARTTAYDGLFGVPRLEEVVQVLNHWNQVDLPQQVEVSMDVMEGRPTGLQLKQSGLYVEFKDATLHRNEAGLDLTSLLLDSMEEQNDLWDPLLTCFTSMRFDEYVVPGLVLQSFEADILKEFHERWPYNATAVHPRSEPPYVLLADLTTCTTQDFWFRVEEEYRQFIQGIGMDKECLLDQSVRVQVAEHELVVHSWTERPEKEFTLTGYETLDDELDFLLCDVKVHGLFSESVDRAVQAVRAGCSDPSQHHTTREPSCPTLDSVDDDGPLGLSKAYVGGFSFLLGTLSAVVLFMSLGCRRQKKGYGQAVNMSMDGHDLEMTEMT